jgi:hypothetical protein
MKAGTRFAAHKVPGTGPLGGLTFGLMLAIFHALLEVEAAPRDRGAHAAVNGLRDVQARSRTCDNARK